MKYDAWHIAMPDQEALDALAGAGYSPLVGYALCARGCRSAEAARAFVDVSQPHDPFLLPDMAAAVDRIRRALEAGEPMAVYGDYDVDGMTSVALLTRFLRSLGGQVTTYVPDRMEEGYGLNAAALGRLYDEGVRLVITVDAGITAIAEAETARAMGLELIITDHHQCRETLPDACAVVNPCRADSVYPFAHLAGVGVAFKLACALAAPVSQDKLLDRYGDLLALGTVADVMPLSGENRLFVRRGLAILARDGQVGLQALLTEAGASDRRITAATRGFTLAPRVIAAGRMGNAALAVERLMTDDPIRAPHRAAELCDRNRTRQQVENEIFTQALDLIDEEAESAPALVLAGEGWHPG
ncbi:MAG: DHH family phosphoesterase, partial [Oscillospiraceae bacterium]|nr:DHH family phosphoesterase [Oscillospiraceae bacterium]